VSTNNTINENNTVDDYEIAKTLQEAELHKSTSKRKIK